MMKNKCTVDDVIGGFGLPRDGLKSGRDGIDEAGESSLTSGYFYRGAR
jgi:hypothetical protein